MDVKTIEWKSDRICHYVLSKLNDMKMNISKIFIEDATGKEMSDSNTLKINTIKYKNEAVNGLFSGTPSTVSVDATIALMMSYGEFPIPEEVRKYIIDAFENGLINPENFPASDEKFENGKTILDAFIESGMPYYSACALTGATFVECGWNVHVFNSVEASGQGVDKTADWAGCGEGLFGLTFWSQKEKIIKELGYDKTHQIPADKTKYNDKRAKHLCDLDEPEWIDIAKEYLKNSAEKDYDVLTNEDEPQSDDDFTEILSASYLWKAACGLTPTFDNVKDTAQKYLNTHKRMFGEGNLHDGFATQICISIALDKYLHGETVIDMNDLGLEISYDIETSGKVILDKIAKRNESKLYGNSGYNATYAQKNGFIGIMKQEKIEIDDSLFKKSNLPWDIKKSCEWLENNAGLSSKDVCVRYVRMAIEHGGIQTDKAKKIDKNGKTVTVYRPGWPWKYIEFLPLIGFKHLCVATRNDKNYKKEPGDIAVYMKNGNPDMPGHICMWTGLHWCSDFKQRSMIIYANTKEAHIFRFMKS